MRGSACKVASVITPDDVHIGRADDGAVFAQVNGVAGMKVCAESGREALDELRIAWRSEGRDVEELENAIHPSDSGPRP